MEKFDINKKLEERGLRVVLAIKHGGITILSVTGNSFDITGDVLHQMGDDKEKLFEYIMEKYKELQ